MCPTCTNRVKFCNPYFTYRETEIINPTSDKSSWQLISPQLWHPEIIMLQFFGLRLIQYNLFFLSHFKLQTIKIKNYTNEVEAGNQKQKQIFFLIVCLNLPGLRITWRHEAVEFYCMVHLHFLFCPILLQWSGDHSWLLYYQIK